MFRELKQVKFHNTTLLMQDLLFLHEAPACSFLPTSIIVLDIIYISYISIYFSIENTIII